MRAIAVAGRIIKQVLNDKRTLALIIIAPLFLITLIYFLLGDSNYVPKVLVNDMSAPMVQNLNSQELTVEEVDSYESGKERIIKKEADALLYESDGIWYLLFESKESTLVNKVIKAVQMGMNEPLETKGQLITEYVFGNAQDSMFDTMGFMMLAILAFFIVFILSGISFVRERTNQTLERLFLTPVKRWQVILGYTIGFGFFAFVQSIFLVSYVIVVLNMPMDGSLISMGIILLLLSFAAIGMGAFFSIFTHNEFQVVQFIPLIVIPQIFFSGLISLKTLPFHLGCLARIMPVYYASDALKAICIKGEGLKDVWMDVAALLIVILLFFIVNTQALKKYRKI